MYLSYSKIFLFRCKEPLKVLFAGLRHYWEMMGALEMEHKGKELGDWGCPTWGCIEALALVLPFLDATR